MTRCPITYEICKNGEKYSEKGLQLLSKNLKHLKDFPYTAKEQIQLATQYAAKLSIQGVQPKLSIKLNVKQQQFEIVAKGGRFILKSPHHLYDEVPQNEDLTMRLAKSIGIEIPFHGMLYNIDGSLSYFIKRFDRSGSQKIGVEDFSQLLEQTRDTKYESSMEKVAAMIELRCTFPMIEKQKLFRLVIFNFLIGNEDMHIKNFSLIRREKKVELTPAYDLLNTVIITHSKEEIALPIRGKKSNLNYDDLVNYFGKQRLQLPEKILLEELAKLKEALPSWDKTVDESFLLEKTKLSYKALIQERWKRLDRK